MLSFFFSIHSLLECLSSWNICWIYYKNCSAFSFAGHFLKFIKLLKCPDYQLRHKWRRHPLAWRCSIFCSNEMSQLHCRFSTNMQLLHLLQLIRFCCMFIPKKYFFFGSAKPAFLELLLIGNTMILYLGGQCNSIISYHIMFLNKDFYHNVIPLIM